jgi:hypothetical protein
MSQDQISKAIVQAAHIIANNGAATAEGTQMGGLEAHALLVSKAINNLADQMGRIADALEESNRA